MEARVVASSARPSQLTKAKRGNEVIAVAVSSGRASFDTVRQIVAGVLTTPRDACVEVHLVSVVLVSPATVMNAMTLAAEHMDKRYESELLLLPSYCSWAMHVVPVLKPRLSCARQQRLLAAAFCKKALQLGAIEVVATGTGEKGGLFSSPSQAHSIVQYSSVPVCLIHQGVARQRPGLGQIEGLTLLESGASIDSAGHFLKSSRSQAGTRCAAPPGGTCNAPSCPQCAHRRQAPRVPR